MKSGEAGDADLVDAGHQQEPERAGRALNVFRDRRQPDMARFSERPGQRKRDVSVVPGLQPDRQQYGQVRGEHRNEHTAGGMQV